MTEKQKKELKKLAAVPDNRINLSDIPEVKDWMGAVRGLFAHSATRHISIRLNPADLAIASRIAAAKGLPCQTYIKSLLHEALERESADGRDIALERLRKLVEKDGRNIRALARTAAKRLKEVTEADREKVRSNGRKGGRPKKKLS